MTYFQYWLCFHLASPAILWIGFYIIFNLWAAQTTSKSYSLMYYIVGVPMMAVDFYVDVVYGTFIFLQWPNMTHLMLSSRMDDLIRNGNGWRQWLATQIVGRLLEPFDLSVPKQHTTYGKFKT